MAETSPEEVVCEKNPCIKQMYSGCEDSKVKEVLEELVDKISEEAICVKDNNRELNAAQSTDISSFAELKESDYITQCDDSPEKEKMQPFTKQQSCNSTRRRSENEPETKVKEFLRRKFGSEGAIFSIGGNIISPEQRKEVNETVEQYIDNLIKDSIFNAIKSVNLDSLYEDVIKDFSNRKHSLNSESEDYFVVEQRLNSNSISELVELEDIGDRDNEKRMQSSDSLILGDNGRISEAESLDNELDVDHASFVGYLADQEDFASVDDIKSAEESLNSSMSSNFDQKGISGDVQQEHSDKPCENVNADLDDISETKRGDSLPSKESNNDQQLKDSLPNFTSEQNQQVEPKENSDKLKPNLNPIQLEQKVPSPENICEQEQKLSPESSEKSDETLLSTENIKKQDQNLAPSGQINETVDLIIMSPEGEHISQKNESKTEDNSIPSPDIIDTLPQQTVPAEDQSKVSWKVGYLHVKLPHKTRGKTHLKAWKKRRVIIQPDEFVNDPKNPSLVISVYGTDSKKHETTFWHSVSSQKAAVFRSSSRTHRYAFTISEGGQPIIHLSSDKESTTQEWMAGIRSVLWPPSPFMELEKMLSGREFEVSIIDNEFSYHAGLLGMYGYLSITPKKLILLHPQQGYVIQEWYLNTVDKFHFVSQPKTDDMHKVLCMTTCRDSSTGQGELIFFCNEAVTLLQSLASNIHQVLSYHSKQEGGKYQKELEEIAEWLIAPPQDCLNVDSDEHYKVPPRQVKSLLDIPNFIFNKSLSPVASAIYPAPHSDLLEPLDGTKHKPITTSHDSGISTCTSNEDFLNCSVASFIIGGGPMTGKSSDSELSDAYTPPRTPETQKKTTCEVLQEEQSSATEA